MSFNYTPKEIERFWANVQKTDACWKWTASCKPFGYGQMMMHRKMCLAHRVSWEIHNGTIPEGMQVLHRCDNPPCTNPDHLFLGTGKDNMADMAAKGRHGSISHPERLARGDRHGSHLHPERVARGERHMSKTRPGAMARGERHGSKTKPETVKRGSEHWAARTPERYLRGPDSFSAKHPDRLSRGEDRYNAKLTETDVRSIRARYAEGVSQRALAREYHIDRKTVSLIVKRVSWRHVE